MCMKNRLKSSTTDLLLGSQPHRRCERGRASTEVCCRFQIGNLFSSTLSLFSLSHPLGFINQDQSVSLVLPRELCELV